MYVFDPKQQSLPNAYKVVFYPKPNQTGSSMPAAGTRQQSCCFGNGNIFCFEGSLAIVLFSRLSMRMHWTV